MAKATEITVKVADMPEVKAALEAAEALAGGCRSFMSSLPFCAPEAVGWQAKVKIAGALAEYERAMGRDDG